MLPKWNYSRRQQVVNGVFAEYAIPVAVSHNNGEPEDCWQIEYGGTLDAAIERIHQKQDHIVTLYKEKGVNAITKKDALFMWASQWLEWTLVKGPEDPDHLQMTEMMESWLVVYATIGGKYLN